MGPFQESEGGMKARTHRCGELTKAAVGQTVVLNGWVQGRRDHGMVMFIDLRDRTGITQVVLTPSVMQRCIKPPTPCGASVLCR